VPSTILVEGGPWRTRAASRFAVFATFPDGTPYRNEGMQRLEIRWGRIHQDRLFEDTQAVAEALARLSEAEAGGDASALPTAHEPP